MRIKICGLTNFDDAQLALNLGATDLGFIFAESPRRSNSFQTKNILNDLPKHANTIAVFKDQPLEEVLSITFELGFKGVQLHGQETQEYVQKLKLLGPQLMVIKTIGFDGKPLLDSELYSMCDALLYDCSKSHFDAQERKPIEEKINHKLHMPFFLAGGLNPQNVLRLIDQHRPDGIDLSSGVESRAGIKDEKLLKDLFKALKEKDENRN